MSWAGVDPFEVHLQLQIGDANNDGRVTNGDASRIYSCVIVLCFGDDERTDINGDGHVTNGDASMANSKILSLPVAKPSGHDCLP